MNPEWGPTYYSMESCGIAAGIFISAIHNMGLTTLTHTPSPMGFLRDLLGGPAPRTRHVGRFYRIPIQGCDGS